MAQLNLVVGDVEGNTSRIIAAANQARDQSGADVVMVPELAVSGYPPEDLLFHSGMRTQVARSIGRLKAEVRGITLIAGYPEYDGERIYNSAIVDSGRRGARQSSQGLPAELPGIRRKALFHPRHQAHGDRVERRQGRNSGLRGRLGPRARARARGAGAQVLLVINASPYEVNKQRQRERQVGAGASARRGFRWCSSI